MDAQQPNVPSPTMPSPNTQVKTFTPNQPVVNPADGKNYTVKQQVPGQGVRVTDPNTQQEFLISEQDSKNLQPSVRTADITIESIAREILAEMGEELPSIQKEAATDEKEINMVAKNWSRIRKNLTTKRFSKRQISEVPTYNESREDRAIREMGLTAAFKPYKGNADETGHDTKTGLPMSEKKEITVGLTEFPKGVDKEKKPEGYNAMTFEQMDQKFEDERPHFKNEEYLPSYTMRRNESDDYLVGKEKKKKKDEERANDPQPRYSNPEDPANSVYASNESIANELVKEANSQPFRRIKEALNEDLGAVEKLPVQFKDIKKAPGKDMGYVEPDVIDTASPDVQTAIDMLETTQKEIADIQATIQEKTAPLQKAIQEITAPLNEQLQKKAQALRTCLDIIHDELSETDKKVSAFKDSIYVALDREKAVAPAASLPNILKKADEVNPQIAEEIRKIKALIESENTKLVLEQNVYKYPVSDVQKKKISAAIEEDIDIIEQALSIIRDLKDLNNSL